MTRLEYSQFGLGEYKFRTESLCYKLEVLSLKDVGVGSRIELWEEFIDSKSEYHDLRFLFYIHAIINLFV